MNNWSVRFEFLHTTNRREQTERIRELAYKGYKIKFSNSRIKLIAFIEAQLPLQHSDHEELKGPYDYVCTKLNELEDIFQSYTNCSAEVSMP